MDNSSVPVRGGLVISLDYELLWGGIEKRFPDGYGQSNVKNVPEVLDRLISLFEKYGVHATVATVGLIMEDDAVHALADVPKTTPSYKKGILSPYNNDYIKKIKKENESLYFSPDCVRKLHLSKNIEVATHTFCHYYCWEEGQTIEEFRADIQKAKELAQRCDVQLMSIVFPRNEVSDDYLKVCSENGISVYRGNPRMFFSKQKGRVKRVIRRLLRIADNYINISGHNTYSINELEENKGCLNVPASRFLRPYNKKFSALEPLRLSRIKGDIRYAAKHNQLYHLWWHPHNFGNHINENLTFLENILKEYCRCHTEYGMQSYTMHEVQEIKTR